MVTRELRIGGRSATGYIIGILALVLDAMSEARFHESVKSGEVAVAVDAG